MATVLQQDVWSLTGATGLGKMVSDVNTAMVQGPLAGAAGVLKFITDLSNTFASILNGYCAIAEARIAEAKRNHQPQLLAAG
jgi:hypothetical protein